MTAETEPLTFPGIQQMLGPFVELPSQQQMREWDENYKEIPAEIRKEHMGIAEKKIGTLLMDQGFRKIYGRLPVDVQSCLPIYMMAAEDLMYITKPEREYEMTA